MTVSTTPALSVHDAEQLASDAFGLAVSASLLPSERDQNFLLEDKQGVRLVLKIAKSDEEPAIVIFQNAMLRRVRARVPTLSAPQVLSSKEGREITCVQDARGQEHLARLVTWVDGEVLARIQPHDVHLLSSLGAAIAELTAGLEDFKHPAMHRYLHWDLRHVDEALAHIGLLSSSQRALVKHFQTQWHMVSWRELRMGVIHGDANDYNILVQHGRVTGVIDFGDAVHSAIICDLAIAIAYAMLDKADPVGSAALVCAAYDKRFKMTEHELDAVFGLSVARLCMSVCYSAYNAVAKHGDEYQQITARPAWTLLEQLADIPLPRARAAIRDACSGAA